MDTATATGSSSTSAGEPSHLHQRRSTSSSNVAASGALAGAAAGGGGEDSRFECNVCLDSPDEPVVTLCGHLFWCVLV